MSRDGRRKEREEQKRGEERYLSLLVALAFLPPKKLQKKIFSSAPTLVHIRNSLDAANIDKFRRPWLAG